MKALTILQPYAHLIAEGSKLVENRSWRTNHRGWLAIHAGKGTSLLDDWDGESDNMVFGAVVAFAHVYDCVSYKDARTKDVRLRTGQRVLDHEHACGPFCFLFDEVHTLVRPYYCKGAQGLWNLRSEMKEIEERSGVE